MIKCEILLLYYNELTQLKQKFIYEGDKCIMH